MIPSDPVMEFPGHFGVWGPWTYCPPTVHLTSFMTRAQPHQAFIPIINMFPDNKGITKLAGRCENGNIIQSTVEENGRVGGWTAECQGGFSKAKRWRWIQIQVPSRVALSYLDS